MDANEIIKVIKNIYNQEEVRVERIPGEGSSRQYYKIFLREIKALKNNNESPTDYSGKESHLIFTYGSDSKENKAFCELAEIFGENSGEMINIPRIIYHAEDYSWYIQSSVGDESLYQLIESCKKNDNNPEIELRSLIEKSIKGLVEIQTLNESLWKDLTFNKPFGKRMVMWDLNYFKYEFVKVAGIQFDEEALENDFEMFASDMTDIPHSLLGFMYRDFQSRNIMIESGKPGFIDFQGGRLGPVLYDIVSLLWQARAGFTNEFRREMINFYLSELRSKREFDINNAKRLIDTMILFRTLQVLGAYGFRGLIEKKAHFIESIPGAVKNLKSLLDARVISRYGEIEKICRKIVDDKRWNEVDEPGLLIEVLSFSYKKGYPQDLSGNGGGFMFDCRGMHNPGRYDEYKQLTGLDLPVIGFLEERGEVFEFVDSAVKLVKPSVETYIRRGFNKLQVGFGCTGGRHRSVYCAEQFSKIIKSIYPEVKVRVIHREQGINKILGKNNEI